MDSIHDAISKKAFEDAYRNADPLTPYAPVPSYILEDIRLDVIDTMAAYYSDETPAHRYHTFGLHRYIEMYGSCVKYDTADKWEVGPKAMSFIVGEVTTDDVKYVKSEYISKITILAIENLLVEQRLLSIMDA